MAARTWLALLVVPLWLSFAGPAWAQQDQRQYVVVYVEFQPTQIHHGKDLLQDLQARAYQDFKNAARTQAIIDRIEPILGAPMDERPGNLIR